MWELVKANKRKSVFLFMGMGICLLLLGYLVGATIYQERGGTIGLTIALFIWFLLSLISYFSGDSIILNLSKARRVTHDVHPQLFNVVEEMKIAANLHAMPAVYIIADPAPNAFATGIKPEKSAIVVTAGLLSGLNRDELQGVVAHEMSHILNRDVLFMTFAGMLLGSIVLISQVFLRGLFYSSGSSRRYRSSRSVKGGGQVQLIIVAVAIAFAILSPILVRLLYFATSRKREYLADASAVRLTRYPDGLASALEKIASSNLDLTSANKVTAPMYIANPLKKKGMKLSNLTSTHPPISERIKILRSMSRGVNFRDYQGAFSRVKRSIVPIIPPSGLREKETLPIREASAEEKVRPEEKKRVRDLGDLMRAVNQYAFLVCVCGLKIKVPPDLKKARITCPRCGHVNDVPLGDLAVIGTVAAASKIKQDQKVQNERPAKSASYTRKGQGWESFSCDCGKAMLLSPTFRGTHVVCSFCGKKTEIKG